MYVFNVAVGSVMGLYNIRGHKGPQGATRDKGEGVELTECYSGFARGSAAECRGILFSVVAASYLGAPP